MRIFEVVIDETPVISSWITDLTLVKGRSGDVTMALENGKRYLIKGVGEQLYNSWTKSSSKGTFWHQNIKDNYRITRIL